MSQLPGAVALTPDRLSSGWALFLLPRRLPRSFGFHAVMAYGVSWELSGSRTAIQLKLLDAKRDCLGSCH